MWITITCWKMAPLNWDVTKLPILCRASFKIIFSRIILVTIEFVSMDRQIEYWIARAESQYLKLRFYFATMTILLLCTIQTFRILKPIINYRWDQCCKLKRILILFAWSLCIMHSTYELHTILYPSNLFGNFSKG